MDPTLLLTLGVILAATLVGAALRGCTVTAACATLTVAR